MNKQLPNLENSHDIGGEKKPSMCEKLHPSLEPEHLSRERKFRVLQLKKSVYLAGRQLSEFWPCHFPEVWLWASVMDTRTSALLPWEEHFRLYTALFHQKDIGRSHRWLTEQGEAGASVPVEWSLQQPVPPSR